MVKDFADLSEKEKQSTTDNMSGDQNVTYKTDALNERDARGFPVHASVVKIATGGDGFLGSIFDGGSGTNELLYEMVRELKLANFYLALLTNVQNITAADVED